MAIRHHLLLDPLMNPPAGLKVRMCREYLRQMTRRHAGAVGEFEEKARVAADTRIRATEVRSLIEESRGGDLRRRIDRAEEKTYKCA